MNFRAFDFLRSRKRAYQLTFGSPAGQEVLLDLVRFCRGAETCFHENERKHLALTGRNEVWLRIQQHLNLTSEQLYALYGGKTVILKQEGDDE